MSKVTSGSNSTSMDWKERSQQRIGDRTVGHTRNYGTSYSGVPLNPNFRARSAAGRTSQEVSANASPDAERVLRSFYPNSPKSQGRT